MAVKIAVLMIVVAIVCLDVCQACGECWKPPHKPPKSPPHKPPKAPTVPPPKTPPTPPPVPKTPPTTPTPMPPMTPATPPKSPTCPVNLLQLSVCTPLLGGIVGGLLPTSSNCCALLNLLGLDVELCLCLAVDANILGLISVNAKVDAVVSILTSCGIKVPPNLTCPT